MNVSNFMVRLEVMTIGTTVFVQSPTLLDTMIENTHPDWFLAICDHDRMWLAISFDEHLCGKAHTLVGSLLPWISLN